MEWTIPLTIPAEIITSLGFLRSIGMGARDVCRGVWEGGSDDMHGLEKIFEGDVNVGIDKGSCLLQFWSVQSILYL